MTPDMVEKELCVMCFQDPRQLRNQEVFLLIRLHWRTHTCNSKHSGDWKQQQFFVTGPGSSSQKCVSSGHHSNIFSF